MRLSRGCRSAGHRNGRGWLVTVPTQRVTRARVYAFGFRAKYACSREGPPVGSTCAHKVVAHLTQSRCAVHIQQATILRVANPVHIYVVTRCAPRTS